MHTCGIVCLPVVVRYTEDLSVGVGSERRTVEALATGDAAETVTMICLAKRLNYLSATIWKEFSIQSLNYNIEKSIPYL